MQLSIKGAGLSAESLESSEESLFSFVSLSRVKAGEAAQEELCGLCCPAVLSL